MSEKSLKDYVAQARETIRSEEEFKALLNDRRGPAAPRPSQDFIDQNIGKPRTAEQIAEAVKDRALRHMRNDREPASDVIEPSERARALAGAVLERGQAPSVKSERER